MLEGKIIEDKNLIFLGGSYEARQSQIAEVRRKFLQQFPDGSVFTLSEHIGSSDRFLKSARKEFPIKPILKEQEKYHMSYDQLNDSYLAWTSAFKSVLVVLPEFDKLYRSSPNYFYEIIGEFLAQQQSFGSKQIVRFVMTLAKQTAIDIAKIPILIGGDWHPSADDIEVISVIA